MERNKVIQKLKAIGPQTPFKVTFRKTNGELREMTCMMDVPNPDAEPIENLKAMPVMEITLGSKGDSPLSWRSFKLDSVEALENIT